jgi:hypothetical protein
MEQTLWRLLNRKGVQNAKGSLMKPVKPVKNQYRGINAHLHSHWQAKGGWDEFHFDHITHLSAALRLQLRPMGYIVGSQNSLQIRRMDEPARRPEADVTIYDPDPVRSRQPVTSAVTAPQVVHLLDVLEIYEEVSPYRSIVIYDQPGKGTPVAWIELLSPSNKPGGQDAEIYKRKRQDILQTGIVFVELDYLHESSPTFLKIPDYRTRGATDRSQAGSSPYRIVVADPRPIFNEGDAYIYAISVDDLLPVVKIPLSSGDIVEFDFNPPYQRTFEEDFCGDNVDYTQLPLNFDRYSDADKARILSRSLAVLRASEQGISLEQQPEPVEVLALDEVLKQWDAVKNEN